jgi:tetratricopeptide (TPR) repeat protein
MHDLPDVVSLNFRELPGHGAGLDSYRRCSYDGRSDGDREAMRIHKLLTALAAVSLALGAMASEAPSRSVFYTGASAIYDLDELTVVYPAGPGEDVENNRLSAELRAGYLRVAHGVHARVRPDDGVSDDELEGNLLLLGWNNRLLGTEQAPRPFTLDEGELSFLGRVESDPNVDLLFYSPSPYNPESVIAFWSRIDPERDRLQVLPLVGSDWAIFTDYRAVRQGMFMPGSAWPPERNPNNESDSHGYLDGMRDRRVRKKLGPYLVSFDPEEIDAEDLQAIGASRQQALAGAAAAIDESASGLLIQLYVYENAEEKERITGVPDPVHSIPSRRELHMTLPFARSAFPHEEVHIIAGRSFGTSNLTTIHEGLALSADGVYEGAPIDLQTAMMVKSDAFPTLDDLLDETAARELADAVRYPAAGMLMRWVWATADPDRRRDIYTLTRGSVEELAAAMGVPTDTVEPSFRKWLIARATERDNDVRFAEYETEARERLLASDYEGVVDVARRMVEIRPDDPQARFNLASALMRTGGYAEAETILRGLLDLSLEPAQSRFVIFSHYQLGRLLDVQGRREDAVAEYRIVLELPDQHDAHRLAREAIESPITPDHLQ